MLYLLIIISVVIFLVLYKLNKSGQKIHKYFEEAIQTFLDHDDKTAYLAAMAAAKTASSYARKQYVKFIQRLLFQLKVENETRKIGEKEKALRELIQEIGKKDWSVEDAREERRFLEKINKEYADALSRSDPTIFQRRYQK